MPDQTTERAFEFLTAAKASSVEIFVRNGPAAYEEMLRAAPDLVADLLARTADLLTRIDELATERAELEAKVARITAMVDHGLHSEDPDEHDCAVSPCWAVGLRAALGIEERDF